MFIVYTRGQVLASCLLAASMGHEAHASSISGPLTQAELQAATSGAEYSPPPPVHFFEPGPITVLSGETADLFAGNNPGREDVDSVLFVISIDPDVLSELGTIDFEIAGIGSVGFAPTDFFSSGDLGFPAIIPGIGNGKVNDTRFSDALHAAAHAVIDGLDAFSPDEDIDDVTVNTPVDLRIDVFGLDASGRIINNTPNSGAIGVTGEDPDRPDDPGIVTAPLPTATWAGLITLTGIALVSLVRRNTTS